MSSLLLSTDQIQLLIDIFNGLPSRGVIAEYIQTNPQHGDILRPLLKKGLNYDEVARDNGLQRILKRSNGSEDWHTESGKQVLISAIAYLVAEKKAFYNNSNLLHCNDIDIPVINGSQKKNYKPSTLRDHLGTAFWPKGYKNPKSKGLDYLYMRVIKVGLVSIPNFSYDAGFEISNIRALGCWLRKSASTWNTKNLSHESVPRQWAYMVYLALIIDNYDRRPTCLEIAANPNKLLRDIAVILPELMRSTPLCQMLPEPPLNPDINPLLELCEQQKALINEIGGLPSHGRLLEMIRAEPERFEILKSLVSSGLNFDLLAKQNNLVRNLGRTTEEHSWDSKSGREGLKASLAALVNKKKKFYIGNAFDKNDEVIVETDKGARIPLKVSSLKSNLRKTISSNSPGNIDYSKIHRLYYELVEEGQIEISGFCYADGFEPDNLWALSAFLIGSENSYSTKGLVTKDIPEKWQHMVYLSVLMHYFEKCPTLKEVRKHLSPLLTGCANVLHDMQLSTPLFDLLPANTAIQRVFIGAAGLDRLWRYIKDLMIEFKGPIKMNLLEKSPEVLYGASMVRTGLKHHGYQDLNDLQREILQKEPQLFVNSRGYDLECRGPSGSQSMGEKVLRRVLELPALQRRVEELGLKFEFDLQCQLENFNHRADVVLCRRVIVEVSMIDPDLFFTETVPAISNETEAHYYDNNCEYYHQIHSSKYVSWIVQAEYIVQRGYNETIDILVDKLAEAVRTESPEVCYSIERCYRDTGTINDETIADELMNTIFFRAGSRMLPSRNDLFETNYPGHQGLFAAMTPKTLKICTMADLYFEQRVSSDPQKEIENSPDFHKVLLDHFFGYLTCLPKPGTWETTPKLLLDHYKKLYPSDWQNKIEDMAEKKFINKPVTINYYSVKGVLQIERIAKAIRSMDYVRAGGRVYPSKANLERESMSVLHGYLKIIHQDPDQSLELERQTGLITKEKFVEQAMSVALKNLKLSEAELPSKIINALKVHFERMAMHDWKMTETQKFPLPPLH